MSSAYAATVVSAAAACAYLLADVRGLVSLRAPAKVVASCAFVAVAWINGALEDAYGTAILVALCLSWIGDVALLWRGQAAFLLGLSAFLAGHIAYSIAFLERGIELSWLLVGAAAMAVVAGTVGRMLVRSAPGKLRAPVVAYIAVIAAMVTLAAGTATVGRGWPIALAAVAFAISDVSVGLDRLPATGRRHYWGTPLYFGAQIAFAWTVG